MTKNRLCIGSARRVVNVAHLTESLNASKVQQDEQSTDPYAIYGTEVPCNIPGSRQHWKSFGLDLTAFVQQRGCLIEFFVTFSAYDGVVYRLLEATSALHAIIQTTIFRDYRLNWTNNNNSQKYYNFQLYTIKEDIQ